ncbi:MAG TPA: NAD(P)H-dependent oxidoreductase subunit E [Thermodesulfobacteriota bacterium]|nr:NAD(P)H-dependent oxidoreductase subunit E [Thermodesulfobacteriota bacterium]
MSKEHVDIDDIIERYPGKPESLIFLLQDIQAAYNYISAEAMALVCDHVGIPLTQAYSVATFYQSFSLEPKGEHEIRVCLGTACHLKGAARIVSELERRLGIQAGETTKDLKYTLETVNCLGACALAPVSVVDNDYQPNTTTPKLVKLLDKMATD